MATIFEMARALGEELQKTPQVEALVAAKAAYESDPEIAKLVEEYTKLHYDFEAKMNAGGISIEEQRAFNEQMKAKGEAIRTNKLASDLYVAEQNFNNFVNSVFNIITATLTGEEPEQGGLLFSVSHDSKRHFPNGTGRRLRSQLLLLLRRRLPLIQIEIKEEKPE